MSINIPDKYYKLLLLLGIIIFGYSFYKEDQIKSIYYQKVDRNREISDEIELSAIEIENLMTKIKDASRQLSITYSVENPISSNDSVVSFNRVLSGSTNQLIVSDSIQKLWMEHSTLKLNRNKLNQKLRSSNEYLTEEREKLYGKIDDLFLYRQIGMLLLIVGTFFWLVDFDSSPKRNEKIHEKVFAFCQSCGENFNTMRVYGTNKDKSLNLAFCAECYKKGKFRNPDLKIEQLAQNKIDDLKHNNWFFRYIVYKHLKRLERWKF